MKYKVTFRMTDFWTYEVEAPDAVDAVQAARDRMWDDRDPDNRSGMDAEVSEVKFGDRDIHLTHLVEGDGWKVIASENTRWLASANSVDVALRVAEGVRSDV